ncbi:MAG TPA: DNA-formamidopyrimidine glycosylase family protein [Acidimicrobiales bacterium]|nr:DNA-formamidopyrimidine glycosylase family protein [Acidimicrobiales bacterium]
MPELPEVEALSLFLGERTEGAIVERVDVVAVSALKTFSPSPDELCGRTMQSVGRRGKFLVMATDGPSLVVHLARVGWIRWRDVPAGRPKPGRGPLALRVTLDRGEFDVTEAGTQKKVAVYVVERPEDVPGVASLGVDPLSSEFTADRLAALLGSTRQQLKGALTDQSLVAGVGNAYSDEALHAARLSPFKAASSLTPEEVESLHTAILSVLADAVGRSAGLPAAGLKSEKRSGMRVHGRTGEGCPVCGEKIRQVAFADRSLQYCPGCQTGGKVLADRRLSRLLK